MGFWVMILSLVFGAILIYLSLDSKFSKLAKRISFIVGFLLIVGAIFIATPTGAEFVMKIT